MWRSTGCACRMSQLRWQVHENLVAKPLDTAASPVDTVTGERGTVDSAGPRPMVYRDFFLLAMGAARQAT